MYENHSMNPQQRHIYEEKVVRDPIFNLPFHAKGGRNKKFTASALSENSFVLKYYALNNFRAGSMKISITIHCI